MPDPLPETNSLANCLDNSLQLDQSLILPDSFAPLLDQLAFKVVEFHGLSSRVDLLNGVRCALSVLLANLWKAKELGDQVYLAVSFSARAYTNTMYNNHHLSHRNVCRVVDYLNREEGEVEKHQGFLDRRTGVGRTSRIILREEIRQVGTTDFPGVDENTREADNFGAHQDVQVCQSSPLVITSSTFDCPVSILPPSIPKEVMRLKSGSGASSELLQYEGNDWIDSARRDLVEWNSFSASHWLDIFLPNELFLNLIYTDGPIQEPTLSRAPDLTKRTLYRVFNNGSWENGGRLYGGWWQEIPSEYRKFITINGQITCEWDFSNMQIAMLYAREGMPLDTDAYSIDGMPPGYRKLVKKIMLQLLNANEGQQLRAPPENELPDGWSFQDIQRTLIHKHEPIARFFRTGIGLTLQKEDADIALKIMTQLQDQGILALPIHDSFIVETVYEDALRAAMHEAYEEHTGQSVSIAGDEMLFSEFRTIEDLPDDEYLGEGLDLPVFERMEDEANLTAYTQYFRRLHAFRDQQNFEWQLRYSGSPTSW